MIIPESRVKKNMFTPRFKFLTQVLLINDLSDLDDFHVNFRTHFLMREMMNKLRFLEENRPFIWIAM